MAILSACCCILSFRAVWNSHCILIQYCTLAPSRIAHRTYCTYSVRTSTVRTPGTVPGTYCTYCVHVLFVLYVLFSATFVHSNFCILSSLHSSILIHSQYHSCTISGRIAILTCISFSVNIESTVRYVSCQYY